MDDLISRQAAIDALRGYLVGKRCPNDGTLTCRLIENEVINKLPPAQPETHEERTEMHECDLINRQQAIDAVVSAMIDGADAELVEGVMELLPSAQSQWIPCSERLPEEERYVLVTASNGAVTEAKYWQKERIWVKGLSIVSVTAWMPLPKGYKGE